MFTLKGVEIVESVRALITAQQLEQIQMKVEVYRSNWGQLPGDDLHAEFRYKRSPARGFQNDVLVDRTMNGRIDGKLYDFRSPDAEQFAAWRDLRYEGHLDGDPGFQGIAALPENPFGGVYGFDEGNLGQGTSSLCATKIPGRAAAMIDKKIDDGRINTGKLVATSKFSIEDNNHFDAPDTEPYNIEKEYIICVPMLP